MRGRTGLVVVVALCGSVAAVDRAAAERAPERVPERATDKPSFTATPAELLAAAKTAPEGDGHSVTLRHERDISFDAQDRATVRDHVIYVVRAHPPAGEKGHDDDDDDDGIAEEGTLPPVVVYWRPSSQDRPAMRARVIAPGGSVAELDPAQIEDPSMPTGAGRIVDHRYLTGRLPHGEPGSVVEWETITRDREPALAGAIAREYVGSEAVTVTYSVPVGHRLVRIERSLPPGVHARHAVAGGRERWTYDLPSRSESPFEPASADDVGRAYVGVSTAASWAAVARAYRAVIDRRIADGPVVLPSALPHAPTREAIDAILGWLRGRLHAGPADFASAPYTPSPPATVLTRGAAGITDHATLLVAVLRQAGIRADLVLLDTGPGPDIDPDLPGLSQFDHVVVRARLATGDVWIDPTVRLTPMGQLSPHAQGRRALVIAGDTRGLVATPVAAIGDNAIREVYSFAAVEDGPSALNVVTRGSGALETELRTRFATRPRSAGKKAAADDGASHGGTLVTASSTAVDDVATPFVVTREIRDSWWVSSNGDYVAIELPAHEALVDIPWTARFRPKTTRTRDYVWSTPHSHEIENRIDLPPGFAPPPETAERVVHLGPATFRELRRAERQTLIVTQRFDTGKRRWTPAELTAFQEALPALEKEPTRIEVERTALALQDAGKFREAAAEDARMIALHPREALHHEELGVLLLNAGLGDAARRELRAAVALEPNNPRSLMQLAWVLHHDRLGRDFHDDWDRAGALEVLHKARAIAPDDARPAFELAQVLQRSAAGVLFGRDADLRGALEAWGAAYRNRHGDADALGLTQALLWSQQWVAAETMARTVQPGERRDSFLVAAIAETQGTRAAIAEASKLRTGDERARLINRALWLELQWQHYDVARALLAEIRDAKLLSEWWMTTIGRLSRHPDVAAGSSDPRTALADLFLALADPARKTQVFWDAAVERDLRGEVRVFLPTPAERPALQGVFGDVLRSAPVQIEGDAGAWHARSTGLWEQKLGLYLVLDRGVARAIGASDHFGGIGRYLLGLDLRDAAAAARARRVLDWVRDDFESDTEHWPTMFKRVWGAGRPSTAEAIQLAAAVLAADSDADRAIAIAERCALPSREARLTCDELLAYLYYTRERWADAARRSEAALAADPGEYRSMLGAHAYVLFRLGRLDDADRAVDGALANHPDDSRVLGARYWLAFERGDAAESSRRLEALLRVPKLEAFELNAAARLQLRPRGDLDRGLELAQRAVKLAPRSRSYTIMLALLEADRGDVGAAARDNWSAMERSRSERPDDDEWCVAARIAEQIGQTDDAIAIYRRIARPAERSSIGAYAARRLAALHAP
jgi:tetratricopeptide (TPR) repeat protein